mmetsp:Transcript_35039/g.75950  ORF Transcript_35039/g.75950 Transcript_35039/m.75950 type:complete len:288 (-) Transcript_35039:307-1170(-)
MLLPISFLFLVLLHLLEQLLLPLPRLLLPLPPLPDGRLIISLSLVVRHEVRRGLQRSGLERNGSAAGSGEEIGSIAATATATATALARDIRRSTTNAKTNRSRLGRTILTIPSLRATGSRSFIPTSGSLTTTQLYEFIIIISSITAGVSHAHFDHALLPKVVPSYAVIAHVGILQYRSTATAAVAATFIAPSAVEERRIGEGKDRGLSCLEVVDGMSDRHSRQVIGTVVSTTTVVVIILVVVVGDADSIGTPQAALLALLFGLLLLFLLLFDAFTSLRKSGKGRSST